MGKKVNKTASILMIAAWMGLVSGLVEGLIFLILGKFGRITGVSFEITWISALVYLLVFLTIGILLVTIDKVFPNLPVLRISIAVFAFLTFLNWIGIVLYERIFVIGLIVFAAGLSAAFTRWAKKSQGIFLNIVRKSLAWIFLSTLILILLTQSITWLTEKRALANLSNASPDVPNIMLIVIDTMRADHLSSYGYRRLTSPNLDRLAHQGVLFENAISPSTTSLPSHASLFTGRYLYEHGVAWPDPKAFSSIHFPTLAEYLAQNGYRTAGFSANLYWITGEHGFNRGFIHYEDYFSSIYDMVLRTAIGRVLDKYILPVLGFEDTPARKTASDVTTSFLDWIDTDSDRPFFVFFNFMDTHDPYLPPQPYRGKFSHIKNPGGILDCRLRRCDPQLTTEQLQTEIDAYDGAISYVDDQIENLLNDMEGRGLLDNTILIITSDHGEAFGEHTMVLHGNSLYREEIRVPLIIWWSGEIPRGTRVLQPVSIVQIPATVQELIKRNAQPIFPGQPLSDYWREKGTQILNNTPITPSSGMPVWSGSPEFTTTSSK